LSDQALDSTSDILAMTALKQLLLETDGQDMVEYALLTTFIGFAGAAAWSAMRTSLGDAYTRFSGSVWDLWEPADPGGAGS
jgi:Flp pilus assembly pilin Flp